MPLHINTKACTYSGSGDEITIYMGRKFYQGPDEAYQLTYRFATVVEDAANRHEKQLGYRFDQTEKYQQLHEPDRATCFEEKKHERKNQDALRAEPNPPPASAAKVVGDTGLEPVTSAM